MRLKAVNVLKAHFLILTSSHPYSYIVITKMAQALLTAVGIGLTRPR